MVSPPHGVYAQLTEADYIGQQGEDDLFIACAKGSIQDIEDNFSDESRVKERNSFGYSALHVAVLSDRPDLDAVIDVVLRNGVDVNGATICEGDTALHLVAHRSSDTNGLQIAIKLLENGAETDIRNKKLRTPYDCAISRNFLPLASILEGTLKLDHAKNLALQKSRQYWGEKLLKAVLESDEKMFSLCLRRDADLNLLNEHGAGAIHYAVTHCNLPTFEVIRKMVEGKCDIDLRDHEGDTALNLVIKTDRLRNSGEMAKIVEYLILHTADVTLKDLDGKDSRELAQERDYDDILSLLGVVPKPKSRTPPPPTPKPDTPEPSPEPDLEPEPQAEPEEPASEDDEELEPLPHRTQVNKPDKNGFNHIHRAVRIKSESKQEQRIRDLVRLRANVQAITQEERDTALHLAVKENKPGAVRQLLKYGARQSMVNKNKKTPLAIAKDNGYTEIEQILERDLQEKATDAMKKQSSYCAVM